MSNKKSKGGRQQVVRHEEEEEEEEELDYGTLQEALQNRINSLVGSPSEYIASLPAPVKRRLNALKNLHLKHLQLEAEFREEILALERKYLGLYKPLYDKRSDFINGKVEPTEEEATFEEDDEEDLSIVQTKAKITEIPDEKTKKELENVKGIPEFWLTVLKNCPLTSESITEKDEEVLRSLRDVTLAYTEDNHGFKIDFIFEKNEFFDDAILSKTYYLQNNVDSGVDDLVYSHAEGCTIHWKKNKDITVKTETKKQRQKGTNKTRTVKRTVPVDSFFHFFNPPKVPTGDEEEVDEALEEKLEIDFETGEMLKTRLIPAAVDWFTGKALEGENDYLGDEDDYDGEEDEEGDDQDEDEDEDEDEEDDEEDAKPKSDQKAGEKPAECKQQ